jgi:putative NADH-flavin reductase
MATILIIGACRGIGREAVRYALKAGHDVRAMARSAQQIPMKHPSLTGLAADTLDEAAVKGALEGVDMVIQTLGVSPSVDRAVVPTRFFSDATRVLIGR